jgi:phosphoesterase RecJ-like protein
MASVYSALGDFFRRHDRFCLLSHVRPDGDAYGSTLALGLSLQAQGKTVRFFNEDGMTQRYSFLPGARLLAKTDPTPPPADEKIIALDTANQDRLGASFTGWQRPADVNIDHHLSNANYAGLNCVDATTPATAQLLYEIICAEQLPLNRDIAVNLYAGLSTDTGSFRYRQTTARTLEIAAALINAGVEPSEVARDCYQSYSKSRLLLLREALNDAVFTSEDRIVYFHLRPEMFSRTGASPEDTEGLIETMQTAASVEVAFVLETIAGGITRVSLRSRGRVDVNAIAAYFGGGGHRLAAGIRSSLPPAEFEKKLLALVQEAVTRAEEPATGGR